VSKITTKQIEERIGMTCYKYAPESFKAYKIIGFSNGNKNIPEYEQIALSQEEISICGNAYACKGRSAALAELKRILRLRQKNSKQYITIGFFVEGSEKTYYYIKSLFANADSIQDKLYVYKKIKNIILAKHCLIETLTSVQLDGNYKPENIETHYDKIDLKRPVKLYFK
jgi:hypothetical protein